MILLLVFFIVGVVSSACNDGDQLIYSRMGHLFPIKFRAFGGAFVSQKGYESSIVEHIGLSESCAECYGVAYMCGWNQCWWPCRYPGIPCNDCLHAHECIQTCDKCTGFK
jgi:hypothetical protein